MAVLAEIWVYLTALDVAGIAAVVLLVATALETLLGVDVIGRRIFRVIWKIIKFFVSGFFMPLKPYWDSCEKFLKMGDTLHAQLEEMKTSLATVEKECTLNGGKSLKDTVTRLDRHEPETWKILIELRESLHLIGIRLDITDEADKRMPYRLTPDLAVTFISPSFLRFFGYTETDIVGNDWEFCIAPESLSDVLFRWKRAVEKHTAYRKDDQYMIDSDGKKHKCSVRGYPLKNYEGDFAGFYGTVEVLDEA